mmetsp:Transcript_11991/g.50420  ORF Transcript_11991/g.50420 Transcript_11991/m.50420 type:complete len:397 (-) Transcript_11991:1644-2834(-)
MRSRKRGAESTGPASVSGGKRTRREDKPREASEPANASAVPESVNPKASARRGSVGASAAHLENQTSSERGASSQSRRRGGSSTSKPKKGAEGQKSARRATRVLTELPARGASGGGGGGELGSLFPAVARGAHERHAVSHQRPARRLRLVHEVLARRGRLRLARRVARLNLVRAREGEAPRKLLHDFVHGERVDGLELLDEGSDPGEGQRLLDPRAVHDVGGGVPEDPLARVHKLTPSRVGGDGFGGVLVRRQLGFSFVPRRPDGAAHDLPRHLLRRLPPVERIGVVRQLEQQLIRGERGRHGEFHGRAEPPQDAGHRLGLDAGEGERGGHVVQTKDDGAGVTRDRDAGGRGPRGGHGNVTGDVQIFSSLRVDQPDLHRDELRHLGLVPAGVGGLG